MRDLVDVGVHRADHAQPGTLVGELSAIDGRPRSASVSTLSAVEVLSIPSAQFNEFLDTHPMVMRALLVDVIDRLRTRVRHHLRRLGWVENQGPDITIRDLAKVRARSTR